MSLNVYIRERECLRGNITKIIREFREAIEAEDAAVIVEKFGFIEDKSTRLYKLDEIVRENTDFEFLNGEKFNEEFEACENIRENIISCQIRYNQYAIKRKCRRKNEEDAGRFKASARNYIFQRKYHLPEMKLEKHNENFKKLLGHFQRKDSKLDETDESQNLKNRQEERFSEIELEIEYYKQEMDENFRKNSETFNNRKGLHKENVNKYQEIMEEQIKEQDIRQEFKESQDSMKEDMRDVIDSQHVAKHDSREMLQEIKDEKENCFSGMKMDVKYCEDKDIKIERNDKIIEYMKGSLENVEDKYVVKNRMRLQNETIEEVQEEINQFKEDIGYKIDSDNFNIGYEIQKEQPERPWEVGRNPLKISSGEEDKDLLISKKLEIQNSNKTCNVGIGEHISLNRFSHYGRLIKAPIKPNV